MHYNQATLQIQKQLGDDWDNREFNYLVAEQVKKIADTLGQFCFSCQNKLSVLNDKVTTLERKIDLLEARVSCLEHSSFINLSFKLSRSETLN
ncbi:hypothetical protein M3Y97_00753800 [Aphelenchoides bicaudatus]|nr:hypothetical protein M3Y97_00753800 [Aphelenchoides bicaudatus]